MNPEPIISNLPFPTLHLFYATHILSGKFLPCAQPLPAYSSIVVRSGAKAMGLSLSCRRRNGGGIDLDVYVGSQPRQVQPPQPCPETEWRECTESVPDPLAAPDMPEPCSRETSTDSEQPVGAEEEHPHAPGSQSLPDPIPHGRWYVVWKIHDDKTMVGLHAGPRAWSEIERRLPGKIYKYSSGTRLTAHSSVDQSRLYTLPAALETYLRQSQDFGARVPPPVSWWP